jgi:hypothetical protein
MAGGWIAQPGFARARGLRFAPLCRRRLSGTLAHTFHRSTRLPSRRARRAAPNTRHTVNIMTLSDETGGSSLAKQNRSSQFLLSAAKG